MINSLDHVTSLRKKLSVIKEGTENGSKNDNSMIKNDEIDDNEVFHGQNPITMALLKNQTTDYKKGLKWLCSDTVSAVYDKQFAAQMKSCFQKALIFIIFVFAIRDTLMIYFTLLRFNDVSIDVSAFNIFLKKRLMGKDGLSLSTQFLAPIQMSAQQHTILYKRQFVTCIFIQVSTLFMFLVIYCLSLHKKIGKKYFLVLVVISAILLLSMSLLNFVTYGQSFEIIPHVFCSTSLAITIMYSLLPLRFLVALFLGTCTSVIFEIVSFYYITEFSAKEMAAYFEDDGLYKIIANILIHVILHCIGAYIFYIVKYCRISTHQNVIKSIELQHEVELENVRQCKIIYSFIPTRFAKNIIACNDNLYASQDGDSTEKKSKYYKRRSKLANFGNIRDHSIEKMSNVSIIFADIVGFTKLSSNKSADEIVQILNHLFDKFDTLCDDTGCEKIGTIGDCYYAVSGCPDPCENHAQNCVEFGLGMVEIIQNFDATFNANIQMRIGIHSGSILCGIVGTIMYKFDIWSNDVTLANRLESEGEADKIHISEATADLLKGEYELLPGKEIEIVVKRKLVERYVKEEGKMLSQQEDEIKKITTFFIEKRTKFAKANFERLKKISMNNIRITMSSLINIYSNDIRMFNTRDKLIRRNAILSRSTVNTQTEDIMRNVTKYTKVPPINRLTLMFKKSSIEKLYRSYFGRNLFHEYALLHIEKLNKQLQQPFKLQQNESRNMAENPLPPTPEKHKNSRNFSKTSLQRMSRFETSHSVSQLISRYLPFRLDDEQTDQNDQVDFSTNTKWNNTPIMNLFQHLLIFFTTLIFLYMTLTIFKIKIAHIVFFSLDLSLQLACIVFLFYVSVYEKIYGKNESHILLPYTRFTNWWIYHILSLLLLSFTSATSLLNFDCGLEKNLATEIVFIAALTTSLLIFLVFNNVTYWIKAFCMLIVFCTITSLTFAPMCDSVMSKEGLKKFNQSDVKMKKRFAHNIKPFGPFVYSKANASSDTTSMNTTQLNSYALFNNSAEKLKKEEISSHLNKNMIEIDKNDDRKYTHLLTSTPEQSNFWLKIKYILGLLFVILTVIYIDIEYETLGRNSFYRSLIAVREQNKINNKKNNSHALLYKIIPEYVFRKLMTEKGYSMSIDNVGVIFATISNYDALYEESFDNGRSLLMILNNIFSDFESLLQYPKYRNVEKVKTIGASFMAASGLNPDLFSKGEKKSKNCDNHLFNLLDFANELRDKIYQFNKNMFNFKFEVKIGYNIGNVVAGVIGRRKLNYDIWGDTVNIASRMCSTASPNSIQLTEASVKRLSKHYKFKNRGVVFVKGKGNVKVHTLVDKLLYE